MTILPLTASLLALTATAFAWGPRGHQIVARTAAAHLSGPTRAAVNSLLDSSDPAQALAGIASEADEIRQTRRDTSNWHFVDIPLTKNNYDPVRDCKLVPNRGDCIINAIERERNVLRDSSQPKARRREALLFITHFLGDLHQPLHCADDNDSGGNGKAVRLNNEETNLHSAWDSGILALAGLNAVEYTEKILKQVKGKPESFQKGDPIAWAIEAHKVARSNAYKIPANKILGDKYVKTNTPVAERQLLRGGLRLAKILNEDLK